MPTHEQAALFVEGYKAALEELAENARVLSSSSPYEVHFAIPADVADWLFAYGAQDEDMEPDPNDSDESGIPPSP